jgi:arylsulfatase A-like enzyme
VPACNAFLLAYDDAIGAVLGKLRSAGLEDNTIVVFASDNANAETRPGSNAPISGGKFNTREGGIGTPLIIKWPGHIPAGRTFDRTVSTLDILPTVTAAARTPLPSGKSADGVDLVPYVIGADAGTPHEVLYWKLGDYPAVRQGKWKLFVDGEHKVSGLFDLEQDEAEAHDRCAEEPAKVAELKRLYDAGTPACHLAPGPIDGDRDRQP